MRLTHIFLGILVFILFSIVILSTVEDIGEDYNITQDKDFTDLKNNITNNEQSLKELIGEDIANEAPGGADATEVTEDDFEGGILRSSWKALSNITGLLTIFKNIVNLIGFKLGINQFFFRAAFTAFIVVISFILISAVMRNRL